VTGRGYYWATILEHWGRVPTLLSTRCRSWYVSARDANGANEERRGNASGARSGE
jgi:hypothetical protein